MIKFYVSTPIRSQILEMLKPDDVTVYSVSIWKHKTSCLLYLTQIMTNLVIEFTLKR